MPTNISALHAHQQVKLFLEEEIRFMELSADVSFEARQSHPPSLLAFPICFGVKTNPPRPRRRARVSEGWRME